MEIDVGHNKLSEEFRDSETSSNWWEEEILPALQVYIHGPTEGNGYNGSTSLLSPRIIDAILLLAMFILLMVASTFF